MKRLALGGAVAAVLAFFFDPQSGARRRNVTRDRVLAFFRRRGRRAVKAVSAEAYGVSQKLQHLREEPKDYDDATLARKVESEIFRDEDAPKGTVDVNVQEGVVQLRGEVETAELIDDLVSRTRKVQGVRDVENLLHVPGAPPPMHQ